MTELDEENHSQAVKIFRAGIATLLLCVVMVVVGGLIYVWIDPELGNKILASAFIIGFPTLFLTGIAGEAANPSRDCEEDSN